MLVLKLIQASKRDACWAEPRVPIRSKGLLHTEGENMQISESLCNMGYPAETHLKHTCRGNSFAYNLIRNCPIVFIIYTEHGRGTTVLRAK